MTVNLILPPSDAAVVEEAGVVSALVPKVFNQLKKKPAKKRAILQKEVHTANEYGQGDPTRKSLPLKRVQLESMQSGIAVAIHAST